MSASKKYAVVHVIRPSAFLVISVLGSYAFSSQAAVVAGKTLMAKGRVNAVDTITKKARKLKRRIPVYGTDVIETSKKSRTQMRMVDGGLLALSEDSKVVIAEYKFDPSSEKASAVIELVKGGLRSVTGAIKEKGGDYTIKTPVGSIGVRGTHFEVEIIDGDMFLAVWDGAIDLTVDTGTGVDTVSFGEGEDFSFGIVSEEGEVTELLEPPETFGESRTAVSDEEDSEGGDEEESDEDSGESDEGSGESDGGSGESDEGSGESDEDSGESDEGGEKEEASTDSGQQESSEGSSEGEAEQADSTETAVASNNQPAQGSTPTQTTSTQSTAPVSSNAPADVGPIDTAAVTPDAIETIAVANDPSVDSIIESEVPDISVGIGGDLEGDLTREEFNAIEAPPSQAELIQQLNLRNDEFTFSNVIASNGLENLQVNMTVNFSSETVTTSGSLSFDDAGGEWFAAFTGALPQNSTELQMNVNFASHGNNEAIGNINAQFFNPNTLQGAVNLQEINNPSVTAGGTFTVE